MKKLSFAILCTILYMSTPAYSANPCQGYAGQSCQSVLGNGTNSLALNIQFVDGTNDACKGTPNINGTTYPSGCKLKEADNKCYCTNYSRLCNPGTTWATANTYHIQVGTETTLKCDTTTKYRCTGGYYGIPPNANAGCTQCPQWSGVYLHNSPSTVARGTSIAGSNTTVSGCYLSAGTVFDNTTGTFELVSSCSAS